MEVLNVLSEDVQQNEIDQLEPTTLGPVSEVTGDGDSPGSDFCSIIWSDF